MLGRASKDVNLISAGLAVLIVLLIILFVLSIHEALSGNASPNGLLNRPEFVAVAVGLLLSILIVERWKSLESKVDKLTEGQRDYLREIQNFADEQIERRIKHIVDKAESLNANVSSLAERHPWLEVITSREIIVETDSCRGILRTSYSLLKDRRYLHLFEYLEYCSRKGTILDSRDRKTTLNGTADDFYELALFCEIWLGDYYLSAQFIKRYIERYREAPCALLPEYLRKLLRVGDLEAAELSAHRLKKQIWGTNPLDKLMLWSRLRPSVSERYKWQASNALALAAASFADWKSMKWYLKEVESNKFSSIFSTQQRLLDAEFQVQLGDFEAAKEILEGLGEDLTKSEMNELVFLYSKMGDYDAAARIHEMVMAHHEVVFGDDEREAAKRLRESLRNGKGTSREVADDADQGLKIDHEITITDVEKSKDSDRGPER